MRRVFFPTDAEMLRRCEDHQDHHDTVETVMKAITTQAIATDSVVWVCGRVGVWMVEARSGQSMFRSDSHTLLPRVMEMSGPTIHKLVEAPSTRGTEAPQVN